MSGATALGYQILWLRELQLVFGTSTFAIATLLAAFMAGLAAGGFALARYADRLRQPLIIYAVLELGIGLYALSFPWLLTLVKPIYLDAWRLLEPGPVLFGTLQFVLVSLLLILPTAAMGATLPLLARFAVLRISSAGDRIGTLYAVNTFGALAGVWLCGFYLLPKIGLSHSSKLAATANLLLGFAALLLGLWAARKNAAALPPADSAVPRSPYAPAVLIAIGLAGFAALAYELAWTRLLTLMLGSSSYTFAVMLIAFLLGIALGARPGGTYADRLLASGGLPRLLYGFAAVELAIALLACLMMYLYPQLPFWYVQLFDLFGAAAEPQMQWWLALLLAGMVMTPPAILMGMHLPMAARAVLGQGKECARPVGIVYGVNALGAAGGAFLAGFVLLPMLGVQGTVFAAAACGLFAAAVLVFAATAGAQRRRTLLAPIALASFALLFVVQRPPWDPMLMTAGMYHYVSRLDDHSREAIRRYSVDLYELLYYEEGLSSVVTVAQNVGSTHRWLAINGKVDASTTDDMPTQVLLGLLPMQFVAQPEEVLVIGLASGVTAGASALLPGVEQLQIVELEPAIGRAAHFFDAWNHSVLSDARVSLRYNDGRNHLLLAEAGSYDLIISEPSNPWISGVANLFTSEFLQLGRSRLKHDGVWSQWVPMYGMDSRDLSAILKTFAGVFPHVLVYASIEYNDLVLIGSAEPLEASEQAAARLFETPEVVTELQSIDVASSLDLLSLYQMDESAIVRMTATAPPNTDDNMFIEYSTATKLHLDTRGENFALLRQHAVMPDAQFADGRQWEQLAIRYRLRGDVVRAAAAEARAKDAPE